MSVQNIYLSMLNRLDDASRGLSILSPAIWLRIALALVFFKSGLVKISNMQSTIFLFEYEYKVPLLDPTIAAYLGTWAELVLPVLIVAGLLTRISSLALFGFNAVAFISYYHALNGWAIVDHLLWGLMALSLVFFGPGRCSLDHWLFKKY
jgi:putative oxidoreductase